MKDMTGLEVAVASAPPWADAAVARAPLPWRLALCNEVLAPQPFDAQCRLARSMGYDGLELAPYTVHEAPERMT